MDDVILKKKCTKCGEVKGVGEFQKKLDTRDGLSYHCKICITTYQKEYKNKNKDRISEYAKKYAKKNKDRISEYRSSYYEKNKQTWKENAQLPEVIKRRQERRKYRVANDPKFAEYERKKSNESYHRHAKKRYDTQRSKLLKSKLLQERNKRYQKKYNDKHHVKLRRTALSVLKTKYGLGLNDLPDGVLDAKIDQILLHRELKKAKEMLKNGNDRTGV